MSHSPAARRIRRPRVVVAGLGDTGLLVAIRLARHADVVGISTAPGLVSGQELGARISRPDEWARDYRTGFARYRGLDRVRTMHSELCGIDLAERRVTARGLDGSVDEVPFDVLVIATGVSNGFWRRPGLQTDTDVDVALADAHDRVRTAATVVVVGGGAAAVSAAANIAAVWPDKHVALCFPGEHALPDHHPRVWTRIHRRLDAAGVEVRPGHRAVIPDGFACDAITSGEVRWATGQPASTADAVVWAVGRVRPNTSWLPRDLLDERGFVVVTPELRVPGHPDVYAVGDVAATDRLRSSARNRADRVVAHNIRAAMGGRPLRRFRPRRRRWGSVLGTQADGLEVFGPRGRVFRFPRWAVRWVLRPLIVRWGIYRGVRRRPVRSRPADG